MNRMLDPLGFDAALKKADFPQPGRNRGERPAQLITPVFAFGMGAPIDLSMGKVLVKTALWIQAHAPLQSHTAPVQQSHPIEQRRRHAPPVSLGL